MSHFYMHSICIPSISHIGLVILPGFIRPEEQRTLIMACLRDHALFPNETNLDIHYNVPPLGIWSLWEKHWHCQRTGMDPSIDDTIINPKATASSSSKNSESASSRATPGRSLTNNPPLSISNFPVILSTPQPPPTPASTLPPLPASQLLYKLRWANIGRSYHWGTKSYDFSKQLGAFPEDIRVICRRAVQAVPWTRVWGDIAGDQDWGDEGENWRDWHDSYGKPPLSMLHDSS
jgi:alkylated DNA repair protein alkB homolog 1